MSLSSPPPSLVPLIESSASEVASGDELDGYADPFRPSVTLTTVATTPVATTPVAVTSMAPSPIADPALSVINIDTPMRPIALFSNLTPLMPDTNDLETPDKVAPPRAAYRHDGNSKLRSQPSAAEHCRADTDVEILSAPVVREPNALGFDHPGESPLTYDRESISYWTRSYEDYYADLRHERGSQRRQWEIGLGSAGICGEKMIYNVSGIIEHVCF